MLWLAACGGGSDRAPDDAGAGELPSSGTDASALGDADTSPLTDASGVTVGPDGAVFRPDAAVVMRALVPRPVEVGSFGWKACLDKFECGSLHVPLDYDQPDAGTVKLALIRHLATGVRGGALLLNPGGPGSSAVDYLSFFVTQATSSALPARFDLVAFDPRGVGYSAPLDCHSTLQKLISIDPTPDTEAEWTALDDASAAFAKECANASPDHGSTLLPFVGTVNVARDMEQVRAAFNEDKLDYLGFSYGTSIGAWYAEQFPTRVGRFVLDGAVDLELNALELALQQAQGFELAIGHYFSWCKELPSRCPWVTGGEPAQAFAALQGMVEAAPIAAPKSDRPLGPGDFMIAVSATMYGGEAGWRALSPALVSAQAGDASSLMTFVDNYFERATDGSYPNYAEASVAVSCVDQASPTVAEIRAQVDRFASAAPIFGVRSLTSLLICAHWPVPGKDLPAPTGRGAPPIVVVGTLNDPATPYAWAQAFTRDLASAVLLTSPGEGHTGYGRGDACIDDAVDGFLLDGTVPRNACPVPTAKSRAQASLGAGSVWLPRRH